MSASYGADLFGRGRIVHIARGSAAIVCFGIAGAEFETIGEALDQVRVGDKRRSKGNSIGEATGVCPRVPVFLLQKSLAT